MRLRLPSWRYLILGASLALTLNPLVAVLRWLIEYLFPMPELVKSQLGHLLESIPNVGTALLVLAIVPAICEEVAFRGFILSGLQRDYRPASALVLSAFLFGFLHVLMSLFQQLFNATLLGIVLGLLAMRSRSLLPGILFHVINNSMAIVMGQLGESRLGLRIATILFRDRAEGLYHWHWVVLATLISAALLVILYRDRGEKPIAEAMEHKSSSLAGFG